MNKNQFHPHHVNATEEDLMGNNGVGRYILLPGSDGRAKDIASHFKNLMIKTHPRGHQLYLGTLEGDDIPIEVATIATGMGCPSMEIILHELFHLGGKRFLRVGTAGSLQPELIRIGDIVHAHGSVRDEHTTLDYVPLAMPAISSVEFTSPILNSAKNLGLSSQVHTGLVHCKSSFYAREFGSGPKGNENIEYINLLTECGVLATEMETAALFIQSQLYNHKLKKQGKGSQYCVLAGALLGILAIPPNQFASLAEETETVKNLIDLSLTSIKYLAMSERTSHQ